MPSVSNGGKRYVCNCGASPQDPIHRKWCNLARGWRLADLLLEPKVSREHLTEASDWIKASLGEQHGL